MLSVVAYVRINADRHPTVVKSDVSPRRNHGTLKACQMLCSVYLKSSTLKKKKKKSAELPTNQVVKWGGMTIAI